MTRVVNNVRLTGKRLVGRVMAYDVMCFPGFCPRPWGVNGLINRQMANKGVVAAYVVI